MQNDDLISKSALKKDVRDVVFAVADTPLSNDPTSKVIFKMGELLVKKIDEAPTVDAVEVVRCRDCEHWTPLRNFFEIGNCDRCVSTCTPGSFFCADGKRDAEVEG